MIGDYSGVYRDEDGRLHAVDNCMVYTGEKENSDNEEESEEGYDEENSGDIELMDDLAWRLSKGKQAIRSRSVAAVRPARPMNPKRRRLTCHLQYS